ncbi:MAG: nucleotidyltransferase family protein [Bacteroidales bacterium]|nr:nucleotidyltransferase family protein [Bacteroidales bacterium]
MKAMILAAGRGTRLQPLTNDIPKALVKAGGMSLLERLIIKMKVQGITEIVINVHHLSDQIVRFLSDKDHFGIDITVSDESNALLDTGGAIFNARNLLDDAPFIVHNVDVLSDIDLRKLYQAHMAHNALATLVVRSRATSRYLLFNEEMLMQGWENRNSGERIIAGNESENLLPQAFSGIHVISPDIFRLYDGQGAFSIIDAYLALCASQQIRAYPSSGLWIDAGKAEGLKLANKLLGGL